MRSQVNGFELRRLLPLALLLTVLALAGCRATPGETTSATGATATAPMEEPASEATDSLGLGEPGETATEPAMEATEPAAGATTTTGEAGATTAAIVQVSENAEYGEILTDDQGMTLYLFTNDTPNTSKCYDDCAAKWPPLLTSGDPVAGDGADESLLGTTERTDGTMQVTYNGWPLYYWVNDEAPGDASGQGVGSVWYVLSPEGEAIRNGG